MSAEEEQVGIWIRPGRIHRILQGGNLLRLRYISANPPTHHLLDGTEENVCPYEYLPSLSDGRVVVNQNKKEYMRSWKHMDPDGGRSPAVVSFDIRLGMNIKALLKACGAIDLWPQIWAGELAVSGSILLHLMDHFPNGSPIGSMHESDIDLYPTRSVCNLICDGDINRMLPDDYQCMHRECYSLEFNGAETSRRERHHYVHHVVERSTRPEPEYAHVLPKKIQLIVSRVTREIASFDFRFLSNYYTRGRLSIAYPGSFVSRMSVYGAGARPERLEKYRSRGYQLFSSNQIAQGGYFTGPGAATSLALEDDDEFPLDSEWRLSKEGRLELMIPEETKPKPRVWSRSVLSVHLVNTGHEWEFERNLASLVITGDRTTLV